MSQSLPSGRRGQILALGLVLLAAALLWFGAASPLFDAYSTRTDVLDGRQRLARRMEAVQRAMPVLRSQAIAAVSTAKEATPMLPADTDSLAAAALQQRLDDVAKKAGLAIRSEEILPAEPDGAFRKIGVRVALQAPYENVVAMLLALAEADLPMVVSELSVRAASVNGHDADTAVEAAFTVTALRAAIDHAGPGRSGQAAAAGAGPRAIGAPAMGAPAVGTPAVRTQAVGAMANGAPANGAQANGASGPQ